ncbi:MAG: FHA domain-containing protein [Phototrophicaceae bacterium]|jgi:pSer/pThr/pTyr-binding forkhead associated (FHA) protein
MTNPETVICKTCGKESASGALICKNCGNLLRDLPADMDSMKTVMIPRSQVLGPNDSTDELVRTTRFKNNSVLYLSIERVNSPITRYVRQDQPIVLGRAETGILGRSDVDLSPYNAQERGVSRAHARISYNEGELFIEDLGSSNGTVLNGETLKPDQRYKIHDGDEIMLGRMMVWVNF